MKDNTTLSRDISFNQLMMIALGGTIGTGLFVGTGGNIASAGPLATLLAYLIGGIIVYSIVLSLGELASVYPTTGSFGDYASRFINPSTGYYGLLDVLAELGFNRGRGIHRHRLAYATMVPDYSCVCVGHRMHCTFIFIEFLFG